MHDRGEGLCHAQLLLLMTKNAMALDDVCFSSRLDLNEETFFIHVVGLIARADNWGRFGKTVQVRARRIAKLKLARDRPQLSSISLVLVCILAAARLFV